MTDQLRCPECGKPLPETSAHGVCPACLMAQAMASRTVHADRADETLPAPPSPEEIAGRFPQFEVVECLGRGGMGVVYKARQKSLDRWVAIKILHQGQGADERFAARFEREARTLAKMSHPNIVTVFDHGEAEGLYYIVMEFVDGVNLRDLLRDGKMEPEQALAIVPPICEALEYAHAKGVVHRDIKPENLLLGREGRVRIADFGIASLVGAEGERSGTPPYMAPEQEQGVVDRRADIYALGAVLYEMLTGERPAQDLVAPSKRVEVDVKIDEMVLRALEKQPERRYQTAAEFRTVVQTIATPAAGAAGAVDAPAVVPAQVAFGGTRWKLLRGISLAGGLAVMVAVAGIIFCVKIVPGWEQGWAEMNRSLSTGEQLLLGMSHLCQRVWPVLALALVVLGAASVGGYVTAVRRQCSRPADGAGRPFRRVKWARLAAIAGGISLAVWILFFVVGELSQDDRRERELAEKQVANDRPSEEVDETPEPETHAWAGIYQGEFAGRKVVWRIVEQNGDYYWLEDPSAAIRDHNRLDQREGALIAEDPAERFRFSPSGAGLLLEVWIKRNGEKVEIELARMEEGASQPVAPEKPPGPRAPPASPLAGLMESLQPLNLTEEQAEKIEHWFGPRGATVNPAALAEFVQSILRDDQQAAFKKIIESGGRPANGGSGGGSGGGASGPIPPGRGAHRKPTVEALGLTEPVQVVEADIFPDGGTQVVRLKDATGKEFAACIDSRMDREAPEIPGSMFIGVRHPSQPGGRKVAIAGPEEVALHAVLLRWAERQPDWKQVAAMTIHEGHEANRLLWELGRFIRALESRLAEAGQPGTSEDREGSE